MATTGQTATEVLNGPLRTYTVHMGTFTAKSLIVWGGNLLEDDTTAGVNATRVGEYDAFVKPGYIVKMKTDADRTVQRIAAGNNGKIALGVCEKIRGVANGTWEAVVREFVPGDILEFEVGDDSATLAVGEKVSFDDDAYNDDKPHGLRVKLDNTNGFGYVLNATSAAGQKVHVRILAAQGGS